MHSENRPLYYSHDNPEVVAAIEVARTQHKKRVTVDYAEDAFQAKLLGCTGRANFRHDDDTGWIQCTKYQHGATRPELRDSVRSRTEVGNKPLRIDNVVRVRVGDKLLWQHPNFHEHDYYVTAYTCPVCLAILATQQPV